jgi:hypothetical protein
LVKKVAKRKQKGEVMKRNRKAATKKTLFRRTLSMALSLLIMLGVFLGEGSVMTAYADEPAPAKTVTGLGIGTISDPVKPTSKDSAWSGSYVYYGSYDGNPVKYRVLDAATDRFGGNTMFLDCDTVLFDSEFNSEGDGHQWKNSVVKAKLNTGEESFLSTAFTAIEKGAIADSTVDTHVIDENLGKPVRQYFSKYTALDHDKIFLLDFEDVHNKDYGYYPDCGWDESFAHHDVNNHKKTGSVVYWWLRSPAWEDYDVEAGIVDGSGSVYYSRVESPSGVSPAFNINRSSVIFSSLISSESASEYKLTILDNNLKITSGSATINGDTVTIPYSITDNSITSDPTQVSVVVTDGSWTDSGWSDGATLLQYGKLTVTSGGTSGSVSAGEGTFTLDAENLSGKWGTNFHVYILAEDVNGNYLTDYASAPVEVREPELVGTPSFSGCQLLLSGQVGVEFVMDLSTLPGVVKSSSYMEFTVNGKTTRVNTSDAKTDAEGHYIYTCFVTSIQMAENITAVFHYNDETVQETCSVKKYIEYIDEHATEYNEKTQNLVHAIADYGHFVQPFLAAANNWTIGTDYKEMSTYYSINEYDVDTVREKVNAYQLSLNKGSSKVNTAQMRLTLDSETALSVRLTVEDDTDLQATATFHENTYNAVKQSDGSYIITITNIPAACLGEKVTITGIADGAFMVEVSALSYAYSVLNSDTMSSDAKNAVASLYYYYTAADAYRKANN